MVVISLVFAVLWFLLAGQPVRRLKVIVLRPALELAGGAAMVGTSLAVVAAAGPILAPLDTGPAVAAPAMAARHTLTMAQLAKDLRQGVRTKKVPANLNPPLTKAAGAKPSIVKNGCSLQGAGVKSKPCIYGDTKSGTSLVLFGDSHAAAWFPALNLISRQQHWRLVDVTKAGCPPADVRIIRRGVWYNNCTKWRNDSEKMIAALHPAFVVVTSARYDRHAAALPGVRTGFGSTWLNGMAATFRALRRSADHVVFISDVPRFPQSVPDCVSGHLSDVRRCTTTRNAAAYDPQARAGELRLAKQFQIRAVDPIPWFCAQTRCPVIVGNILLYRDDAHMVPAWSRFLAPVLADAIVPIMQVRP
jgi:SGNH domain (fused to AT3 domains)